MSEHETKEEQLYFLVVTVKRGKQLVQIKMVSDEYDEADVINLLTTAVDQFTWSCHSEPTNITIDTGTKPA